MIKPSKNTIRRLPAIIQPKDMSKIARTRLFLKSRAILVHLMRITQARTTGANKEKSEQKRWHGVFCSFAQAMPANAISANKGED